MGKNQAMPAEPKDTKPAEKKPETEKIAEAKKTERGEPSKPATTTDADHTTGQTSANANGLPGILADLTPFMGPMQAEQLAQFLRNISAPQENQEPEKRSKGEAARASASGATWPAWPAGAAWPTWRSHLHFLGACCCGGSLPTPGGAHQGWPGRSCQRWPGWAGAAQKRRKPGNGRASASTRERGRGKGEEGR